MKNIALQNPQHYPEIRQDSCHSLWREEFRIKQNETGHKYHLNGGSAGGLKGVE